MKHVQSVVCLWRVFPAVESGRARIASVVLERIFSLVLSSGVPVVLMEDICQHRVRGYGNGKSVATVHSLWKSEKIRFISVVVAIPSTPAWCLQKLLQLFHFSLGTPIFSQEFTYFRYASGWHDLVSRDADADLVRASINPSPQATPASGTASRPAPRP